MSTSFDENKTVSVVFQFLARQILDLMELKVLNVDDLVMAGV